MTGRSHRPRTDEYRIAVVAVLGMIWLPSIATEGSSPLDPLYGYYQNTGIRIINITALAVDIAIATVVFHRHQHCIEGSVRRWILVILAIIAMVLTWLELWYGTLFSYGEIRDKQGLPYAVNNMGVLGSFLFTSYAWWQLPPFHEKMRNWRLFKIAGNFVLFGLHVALIQVLKGPWHLWQS